MYSSGAGIAVRVLREALLGLRLRRSSLCIDRCCRRRSMGWSRASSWKIVQLRWATESARWGTGPEQ